MRCASLQRSAALALAAAVLLSSTGSAFAQTPAPTPTDVTPPVVNVTVLTKMRSSVLRKGIAANITLNEPGSVTFDILDAHLQQINKESDRSIASLPNGGSIVLTSLLTPSAKAKARHGKVRWTLEIIGTDGVGNNRVVHVPFRLN